MEVAQLLVNNYETEIELQVTGNYRLGDIRHNFADISKITRLLGFKPSISFADGLKRFTDWVNKQSVQTSRYDESVREMKEKGLMK
jgi:dTDP-L-rhamnose 4-epimerase